jgi:hypothetical protein
MCSFRTLLVCPLLVFLTGCASSTPESRVARDRAAFDAFPTDVQQKILAGQVAVGFTPEMVELALGEPSRRFTRETSAGRDEVWVYLESQPQMGIGLGFASYGRRSATAVGVDTTTGGDVEEKMRVEFRDGRVRVVDYLRH